MRDPAGTRPAGEVGIRSIAGRVFGAGIVLAALAGPAAPGATDGADPQAVKRGEYIFRAGGCKACHTDVKNKGPLLAGGRPLKTPFGTFYSPNITPDPTFGIGKWSDEDFIRALRQGIAPDGYHYYPVFPYTSFTKITDADLLDLKAYIFSLPPVSKPRRPHEVKLPFRFRPLLGIWKLLHFTPGAFKPMADKSAAWNRGAYLTEALGRCAECHTPRTLMGGLDTGKWMAGTDKGPGGEPMPNITPDEETGIGEWDVVDIVFALKNGLLPDGDAFGSVMAEIVEDETSHLTEADLRAIALYLLSLPPIYNKVGAESGNGS